ncbi:MAG: ribosome small subunit-dependent GTPase A [Planctomycetota bacterium]
MTLREWGWDDHWAQLAAQLGADCSKVARIVGQDRASWSVRTHSGPEAARIPSASGHDCKPVVGDWVLAEPGPMPTDPWSIVAVFPRRSWISRGVAGTGKSEQVLAANVDKVWVVHGLDLDFNPRRLERYLAVVWESGASPEIILTKSDLADDLEAWVSQVETVAVGVPIRVVSARDSESVQILRDTLNPGSTASLLGPSGVGKSTLVNLLSEATVAATGEVRSGDQKGRHVTTRRDLYRIPGGALLLDAPGIRELRVWALEEGLDHAFPDIEQLSHGCRFRDCRHEGEPNCAVQHAIEGGDLEPERLNSFKKLRSEAAYEMRKTDPRARAAAVSEWKTAMKTMKYHPKYRDRS